jgi:hypothetical protein
MLQTVELPAGVAHLAASLAHVDRDALPLQSKMADFYQNNLNWKKNKVYILKKAQMVMFYSFLVCQNQNKMADLTKIQKKENNYSVLTGRKVKFIF